jgi:perosamine synthetase
MTDKNIANVITSLENLFPKVNDFIALHEPKFSGNEWNYVKDCLDSTYVSSVGAYVERFESDLKRVTGVKHVIAVVNGTAALHICLKIIGVEQGDEVLIPTMTFVATANAVSYNGAIPHFVDSSYSTLGLDPEKLDHYLQDISEMRNGECFNKKTGRRIKAVLPVHTFGHPVDLDSLVIVCERYKLELVEDAAESLGSFYKGKHTGNWGKVAALSFNGNKIITTGGGGAILTNDDRLGNFARHLTTTAKVKHPWLFLHDEIGFNYRMPNINAALGCAHLETLPRAIENKRELANSYQMAFLGVNGVEFFTEPSFAKSNYWLNVLLLDEYLSKERDSLLDLLNGRGIMVRPAWTLMHELDIYKHCPKMDSLSVAQSLSRRLINIPSSPHLVIKKE